MLLLHPGWLTLLLLLPFILLGAILAHRSRSKAWRRMVAPRLRKQLVRETPRTRHWIALGMGLTACALIIAVIARPYRGETSTTEQIRTRNLIIAVDTSRSMLARDASPDRISSAKATALELIEAFPDDRIGVIAFSGTPLLIAPLTIDHTAVRETISQLDTDAIPYGGSDLAAAVRLAVNTFRDSHHRSNALIIISDGEDHSHHIDRAGSAIRNSGIAVCTIGIGTKNGGIIPDINQPDGKFRDTDGHTVLSQLNPAALQQLAAAGQGTYIPASTGTSAAVRSALSSLHSDLQQSRTITVPHETYQWFLLPAVLLLTASLVTASNWPTPKTRHPLQTTSAAILVSLLATTPTTKASSHIEQATAAYKKHNYQTALQHFTQALKTAQGENRHAIQFSQGSAAYQLHQWQRATRHYSQALQTKNKTLQTETHYNLANSLFQTAWSKYKPTPDTKQTIPVNNLNQAKTLLLDAITHYQSTLKLNPNHPHANHNLKEAQKLLKQLQQTLQQAQQQQQNNNQNQQGEPKKPQPKKQPGNTPDPNQTPDPNNPGTQPTQPDPHNPNNQPNTPPGKKNQNTPENPNPARPRQGETKEAFAARILKEHADTDTRPVSRRHIKLRRPPKDW